MSFQNNGVDISLLAAADLSGSQFLGVKIDSAGKAALAGVGEQCIGVLQNKPSAGQAATVRMLGVTKMKASGVIAAGARIAVDASAKAKVAVASTVNTSDAGAASDAVAGSNVIGVALEAATAANDLIAVALLHSGAIPTTAA